MTKPVRLVDAARDEFLAAVARYGAKFNQAARAAFKRIGRFPEAWGAFPGRPGVRRFAMKRYPFIIVYRELSAEIRVLAVAQARLLARPEVVVSHRAVPERCAGRTCTR